MFETYQIPTQKRRVEHHHISMGAAILAGFVLILSVIQVQLVQLAAAASATPVGTYSEFNWPTSTDLDNFTWRVTPRTDATPDGYFYSHQFAFNGGDIGYLGIQTLATGAQEKKGVVFSIWNAVAAVSPHYAGPFGGEGSGYTAVIPYEWSVDRTYELSILPESTSWWQARITDTSSGAVTYIGKIQVPAHWGKLASYSVAWSERYSGPTDSCSDIGYSSVDFTQFRANNQLVTPVSRHDFLSNQGTCATSKVSSITEGSRQEMGIGSPTKTQNGTTPSSVVDQPSGVDQQSSWVVPPKPMSDQQPVSKLLEAPTNETAETKQSIFKDFSKQKRQLIYILIMLMAVIGLIKIWDTLRKRKQAAVESRSNTIYPEGDLHLKRLKRS